MHLEDEKKTSDLKTLFSYFLKSKIDGFCANFHFDCLLREYPWQSLSFSKMFGTGYPEKKALACIKRRHEDTKNFILMAPLKEEERILMETFLNEFERIVEREIKSTDESLE